MHDSSTDHNSKHPAILLTATATIYLHVTTIIIINIQQYSTHNNLSPYLYITQTIQMKFNRTQKQSP